MRSTTRNPHPLLPRSSPTALSLAVWGCLLLGTVADLFSTGVGLQMGLREGNPIAAMFLFEAGFIGLIGFKLAAVVFAATGTSVLIRLDDTGWLWLYVPSMVGAIWAAAAFWNALHIAGML